MKTFSTKPRTLIQTIFTFWASPLGPHPTQTCPAKEVFSHRRVDPLAQYHTFDEVAQKLSESYTAYIPHDRNEVGPNAFWLSIPGGEFPKLVEDLDGLLRNYGIVFRSEEQKKSWRTQRATTLEPSAGLKANDWRATRLARSRDSEIHQRQPTSEQLLTALEIRWSEQGIKARAPFTFWAESLGSYPPHTCPASEVFSLTQTQPLAQYRQWGYRQLFEKVLEEEYSPNNPNSPARIRYAHAWGEIGSNWERFESMLTNDGIMRHGSQGRRRFTRGKFGNTEPRPENKFLTTGPPPHVDSPFRIPLHRHCYPTVQTPNPPSTFEEEWIPSLCYNTTTITAASQTSEEEQKEKEICTFTRDVPPPCFDAEHRQWRKIHSVSVITTLPAMKRLARLGGLDTLLKNEHGRDPSGGGTVGLPPGVYEIKGIEGKGLGTVARQFIRAGTEVMNDAPLIMVDDLAVKALKQEPMQKQVEKLMAQAVGELAEDLRTHFGQLSGRFSVEDHDDGWETKIFGKNAFLVKVKLGGYDDDGEEQKENEGRRAFHAVFRDVSRINHDCSPNMGYYFDQKTLTLRVIAARDIHPGEEMTIGYVDLTKPCPVRQKLLNQSWGFPCTCRRCTLPPYQKEESNSRAEQIHALRKELDSYSALGASPEKAELLITLYELEGIQARIYEAYYRAAVEWNGVGNAAKAAKHARLCLDRGLSLRSEDSPFLSSMRLLVQDPKEHWSWRFRVNLKDARGDKAR